MSGVLLLAGLLLSSPTGRDDDELTAVKNAPRQVDASRQQIFSLAWRRPMVRTGLHRQVGTSFGAPALSRVDDIVVAASGEGDVRALRVKDGTVVWEFHHRASFETSIVIIDATEDPNGSPDELAILGARDGELFALEVPTGKVRWQETLEGDPRAPAQSLGEQLLVTTSANKLYVLDSHSGNIEWSKGRPMPNGLTVVGHAMALAQDGVVYTSFSDGYAEAYRLADGSAVWSSPLSIGGGDFVDADADPVIVGDKVIFASYSDGIYGLNIRDGQAAWHRRAPAVTRLVPFNKMVIAASADGYLWGLEQEDGTMVYRTRFASGDISRMVVRDNLVVLNAGESGLVVFDGYSGKPLQAAGYGEPFAGDLAWEGEELAFVAASGYLYLHRMVVAPSPALQPTPSSPSASLR
ncbi:MAG: hypothetical protein A2289_14070 [Deltaproteobacteria bacterium RIFOXYA12_FULL_58_15]|nr:MAG: hypothetical protein A2289_14070 [Deltaproteobacteria bacterium RIFOXYA12_FULL_58_15]OGR13735.1 MAG: hypothetical protein A2341_20520 [Deltaproteobacteria bacterium RIFOXYB12_FULL_58_9]